MERNYRTVGGNRAVSRRREQELGKGAETGRDVAVIWGTGNAALWNDRLSHRPEFRWVK